MTNIPKIFKLNNGVEIPMVGIGVNNIENSKVSRVISWALKSGYRHIDTASAYENEEGVGRGIRESGFDRDQIFITTKLAANDFPRPEKAFSESLSKLHVEYIDLYLLHWPFVNWINAWSVLEDIYEEGRARAIGVSNFNIEQLEILKNKGRIKPVVNQIEVNPFVVKSKLIDYCQTEGIAVEAHSPLSRGKRLNDTLLETLAKGYGKTTAQIMIRWGLQRDFLMIPKSKKKSHLESNIDVFDFEIEKSDMQKIDSLNENNSPSIYVWGRIN